MYIVTASTDHLRDFNITARTEGAAKVHKQWEKAEKAMSNKEAVARFREKERREKADRRERQRRIEETRRENERKRRENENTKSQTKFQKKMIDAILKLFSFISRFMKLLELFRK